MMFDKKFFCSIDPRRFDYRRLDACIELGCQLVFLLTREGEPKQLVS